MSIDAFFLADQKAIYIACAVTAAVLVTATIFSTVCSRDASFLFGAFTVGLLGAGLSTVAFLGDSSHGLVKAKLLVEANTGWNLGTLLDIAFLAGLLIAVVAFIGIVGATRGFKNCVSVYLLTTVLSGGLFICNGNLSLSGMSCSETYPKMYQALQCSDEMDGSSTGLLQGLDADVDVLEKEKKKCKPEDKECETKNAEIQLQIKNEKSCNGVCQNRLSLAQSMGGCDMLTYLCSRNTYGLVGEGGTIWKRDTSTDASLVTSIRSGVCLLPHNDRPPMVWLSFGPRPSIVTAESAEEYCRQTCNKDLDCTGFSYMKMNRECAIISPNNPDWVIPVLKGEKKVPHWKQVKHKIEDTVQSDLDMYDLDTPGDFGVSEKYGPITTVFPDDDVNCYVKMSSRIISRLLNYASALGLLLLGLGVAFSVSALHGIFLFMARKRRAKTDPAVSSLLYAMFCPCLPGSSALLDEDVGPSSSLMNVDDSDDPME
eukprot:g11494.t1